MSVAVRVQPSRLIAPTMGISPINPVMTTRANHSGVLVNQNRSSLPSTTRDRHCVPSHHHRPSEEISAGMAPSWMKPGACPVVDCATITNQEAFTVNAFAIDEFGKPGTVQDMPIPEPAEGEVRVKVSAAAINPMDVAVAKGFAKD